MPVVVQSLSRDLPPSVLYHLPEFAQTHAYQAGDATHPSHPLPPPSLALHLSQHQGLFHLVGFLHQVAKVLELQLQHQFFQWIFRVDSFRIEWFDLPAVQGTLKSLLQYHNSKVLVQPSWRSNFLYPYVTVGKTIALMILTFVGKVMSLLFNTLSRFVIAILPRSKCHLIF